MTLTTLALLAALCPQGPSDTIDQICSRSAGIAQARVIGTSIGDRPIRAVTLTGKDGPAANERPGILILAGTDGKHQLGSELALWQLGKLVDDYNAGDAKTKALLNQFVVHVIPVANPDGKALGRSGNARAVDLDRDGKIEEDGYDDLDGDKIIAQMRWLDADGEWIIDPDEPRLMRKADRKKSERGTHSTAVEARDNDGDEERAEDPVQGILIHRNFSHRHDEFDRATGPFPMSEPSTKAIADFVFARRNIVLAFVYDRDDNLLSTPKVGKPKARTQLSGIVEKDKDLLEKAGELFREKTERKGKVNARMDGSPWSWLYFQVGVRTFASDVWRVPETFTPKAAKKEDGDDGDTKKDSDKDLDDKKSEKKSKPKKLDGERARLAFCDKAGKGFVAWHRYKHPKLGKIEIGGFAVMTDAELMPEADKASLFQAHHDFAFELTGKLPEVFVESFTKKDLGNGAWRLEAVIENKGTWPTLSGSAERSRRFATPRLVLELGKTKLLQGQTHHRASNLEGNGGRQKYSWIVSGKSGQTITLKLRVDPIGGEKKEIQL